MTTAPRPASPGPASPGPASPRAVPLWRQIAQGLSAGIGPRGLRPGDRLPTEAQLAAQYGVNRHTIRRAIESMAQSGLVRVEQGRGTFVAEDKLDYEVLPRTRFNEWIRRQNREPSGQVLHVRAVLATAAVAAGLGVARGGPVVAYERLGLADGLPVALTSHHFPQARLPGIMEALQRHPTITAALAAVGVANYVRRITRVGARMPTAAEGGLLRVSRSRPLLVCENTNVDDAGAIVEFGIARYPSTRVQVVFEP